MAIELEYRVNKIERFIVTRFTQSEDGKSAGVEERGQYASAEMAREVAYALCKLEHQGLGWPIGDERIKYPENPAIMPLAVDARYPPSERGPR